jgi:oxygen-independent coproporphyrinogen-3 oxidase
LVGVAGLERLLDWVRARFPGAGAIETTVEVNPEHATVEFLAGLVRLGVHRVSLGVQSLRSDGLVQLGRVHDRAQALRALREAAGLGMQVSADLIAGWQGQAPQTARREVAELVDAGVEHVSVYALTIEAGTPWEALVRRGQRVHPDPDQQSEVLIEVETALQEAGLEHYEVSSYARPGAHARHNAKYWTWADYVGLGPSAASATYGSAGTVRRANRRGFQNWLDRPSEAAEVERLTPRASAAEGLWTGLRVLSGLSVQSLLRRFPAVDRNWLDQRTSRQIELGNLVWQDQDTLVVRAGRWLFHDSIAVDLMV